MTPAGVTRTSPARSPAARSVSDPPDAAIARLTSARSASPPSAATSTARRHASGSPPIRAPNACCTRLTGEAAGKISGVTDPARSAADRPRDSSISASGLPPASAIS